MDGIRLQDVKPAVHNPHSNFDLSFKRKYTCKFGQLFPIAMIPVNPDENFSVSYDFTTRFAPFVSQVYQDYRMAVDWFFVPNRLLWKNFELFMKGGWDGNQEYVHPFINFNRLATDYAGNNFSGIVNLFNALDIPTLFQTSTVKDVDPDISALPMAAYYRIFLDHFIAVDTPLNQIRSKLYAGENYLLNDGYAGAQLASLAVRLVSGSTNAIATSGSSIDDIFALLDRLYPLDYFTSARSNPQLGPVMTIPLQLVSTDIDGSSTFRLAEPEDAFTSNHSHSSLLFNSSAGSDQLTIVTQDGTNTYRPVTINAKVLENRASIYDFYSAARAAALLNLYGYTGFTPDQSIAAEFGVKSRDERAYMSERLFHFTHDLSVGEVFSNSVNVDTNNDNNLLDVPGVGTAVLKGQDGSSGFRFFSGADYGYLVGLASCYPEAAYSQGLPRHYLRLDRWDYPHPSLANLGMQDIKQCEIYNGLNDSANRLNTFAYTSRYGEDKVGLNRVNGQLGVNLSYLTASRLFSQAPAFNDGFTRVLPAPNQLNRTFNVVSDLPFDTPVFCDFKLNIFANRPLPKYGLFEI